MIVSYMVDSVVGFMVSSSVVILSQPFELRPLFTLLIVCNTFVVCDIGM